MQGQQIKSFVSQDGQNERSTISPAMADCTYICCDLQLSSSISLVPDINNSSLTSKDAVNVCKSKAYEPYIELAIDVFKAQNKTSINHLKDFLTILPSPKCIEEVLLIAVYRLAEIDFNACRWICNSRYLEPELDLVEVAKKFALTKLENQGFVVDQHFKFDPNGYLQVKKEALAGLMMENSAGDTRSVTPLAYRLLLEEILQVRDFT